jgi:hypothetical protein
MEWSAFGGKIGLYHRMAIAIGLRETDRPETVA